MAKCGDAAVSADEFTDFQVREHSDWVDYGPAGPLH